MKKLDAIIPAERLTRVHEAAQAAGASGVTVFDSKGRGQIPIEPRAGGRGTMVITPEFNTNAWMMTVVKDGDVNKVIDAILGSASSGLAGEGKVFVTNVDKAIDIGTKKSGEEAL